jgi:hypothetical protein
MKRWYLVDCEIVHPTRYRIFAEDAESAMRMCLDHGEELHVMDITDVRPIYAYLEERAEEE